MDCCSLIVMFIIWAILLSVCRLIFLNSPPSYSIRKYSPPSPPSKLELNTTCSSLAIKKESYIEQKSDDWKIPSTTANGNLKPGVVLNKIYEIKKIIKSGGMGAVYFANNRKFDTDCAVKELLSHSINDQNQQYMINSFEREAKILHKLRHPNIPVVIDYFIECGRYYLVMDYIDGKDVDTIIDSYPCGIIPENTVIEWAKEILNALDYLHNQNPPVIYRDMKPGNIMIRSSDNKIILVDFGIARAVNPDSQTKKTAIGTSGYTPAEQYRGKAEPRSDLYALGATMHHLLSGIEPLPFRFEPLKKVNPKISDGMEKIVMKALKDNLEERFPSAKEMKEAIDKLSSHF